MAIVQAFNRERAFQGQFDELNGENRTANVYAQKLFSVFFPSIELLGASRPAPCWWSAPGCWPTARSRSGR